MPDWWETSYHRGLHSVNSGNLGREFVRKLTRSETAKPISTPIGTIRPDLRGPGDVIREVKTGMARWSLPRIRAQLRQMLFLRDNGYTARLEYWFVESPYSHSIGPDAEFEKALGRAGMPIIYAYKDRITLM